MKFKTLLGFSIWLGMGLFSMVLGWKTIVVWVCSAYLFEMLVKEEEKK